MIDFRADEAKYWFSRAVVNEVLFNAYTNCGLYWLAGVHKERAVYCVAEGLTSFVRPLPKARYIGSTDSGIQFKAPKND